MKRCPACQFPNKDDDRTCFKCGSLLNPEPVPAPEPPKPSRNPMKFIKKAKSETLSDLTQVKSPLTDTPPVNTVPVHTSDVLSDEELAVFSAYTNSGPCVTTTLDASTHTTPEFAAPPTSQVPPLTTAPPLATTPTRILPKYPALNIFGLLLRIWGVVQGIVLMGLGVVISASSTPLVAVVSLCLCILLGIVSILLGFIFSNLLGWMRDIECNQRKQIELLNHLFHQVKKPNL